MLAGMAASAQVTNVEPTGANYANKTVSFRVWWNAGSRNATHFSKVWVWVDYIQINSNNTTSGNTWTRALVSGTPTVSIGTVARETGNNKGFWLQGNSDSYSATVTVQLNITANKFNWCAYASDYPPNVTLENGTYIFKGTTDFIVSNPSQTLTSKTIAKSNLTVNSSTTFTDATACPGIGSLYCPYTGSDLYMDATHLCQQRTSGAKNWETWIKDTRDNELYKIVLMPDNNWWTAEEIRYDASATHQSYKCLNGEQRMIYNRPNVACPVGWTLPSTTHFSWLHNNITDQELLAANTYPYFGTGTDKYGFSVIPSALLSNNSDTNYPSSCINDTHLHACSWDTINNRRQHCFSTTTTYNWVTNEFSWNQVRCIRQL
jgi:uncharacterized protein (TIGR02145 family)